MKVSKTTRWVLTIGIFAIILVALGVAYSRQMTERSRLNSDIAKANQAILEYTTKYTAEKNDLEARLTAASSWLATVQNEFRRHDQSIEICHILFQAAEDANVTITELRSSLPEDEEIGTEQGKESSKEEKEGVTFQVFSITVTAEGPAREIVELLHFSNKVSEKFPSATIEYAEINVPELEEEGESEEKSTIELRMKIYFYEGQ